MDSIGFLGRSRHVWSLEWGWEILELQKVKLRPDHEDHECLNVGAACWYLDRVRSDCRSG